MSEIDLDALERFLDENPAAFIQGRGHATMDASPVLPLIRYAVAAREVIEAARNYRNTSATTFSDISRNLGLVLDAAIAELEALK